MNNNFLEKLLYGQEAEIDVSTWLIHERGCYVIPRYLPNSDDGAPSLFAKDTAVVLPDLEVFKGEERFWFEVKRKVSYGWRGVEQTGFSPRLLREYKATQEMTGSPVFIGFYDESVGWLYGNWLNHLCRPRTIQGQDFPRHWDGMVGLTQRDKPIIFFPISEMVRLSPVEKLRSSAA